MWSLERLRTIESRLGPYAWASLYQGSPRPKGGALFGAITWASDAPTDAVYAGGVDLARTAKSRSDHQAAVMLAKDPNGIIYVVDIEYARELLTDRTGEDGQLELGFARRLHSLQRRWHGAPLRMYAGGAESALVDLLATHHTFPAYITQHKATDDKWGRAQPLAVAVNSGRLRILRTLRHADELARQLARFTGLDGDSDDLVDALAAAYDEISAGPVYAQAQHTPEQRREIRPVASLYRAGRRGLYT
jgi:phage terminase large subunit-like protein